MQRQRHCRPSGTGGASYGPADDAMRAARTCYDHLAGRLGVAIADAMVGSRMVIELTARIPGR